MRTVKIEPGAYDLTVILGARDPPVSYGRGPSKRSPQTPHFPLLSCH